MRECERQLEEYRESIDGLEKSQSLGIHWGDSLAALLINAKALQKALAEAMTQIGLARAFLADQKLRELQSINWQPPVEDLIRALAEYRKRRSEVKVCSEPRILDTGDSEVL